MRKLGRRIGIWSFFVLFTAGLVLVVNAGKWLVVDDPKPSDVIVVLAGETDRRPAHALQLLNRGYARRVVIDVSQDARVYDSTIVQLAQEYIRKLPEAANIEICPI